MPTYADSPQTIASMYFIYKWSMILLFSLVGLAAIYVFTDNIISKIKTRRKTKKGGTL